MERGGVVRGSRGYKKAMNLPEEGYLWRPDTGGRRVRVGGCLLALGWEWGNERRRGFKMDLCKRRRLQCERSVVHSGKSLSHALSLNCNTVHRVNNVKSKYGISSN